jgi:prepilin-type N-terminal cleavage/methylation domain-containing protein
MLSILPIVFWRDYIRQRDGSTRAFTLIELSVVLVIIGLLAGAVLVGHSLISAAAVRATISQVEKYSSAANTFRTKYDCVPGDCPNAVALGLGTTGGPGDNGNGDTQVYSSVVFLGPNRGSQATETFNFWYHLSRANLIEGGYTGYPAGGFSSFSGNFSGFAPVTRIRPTTFINAMSITDTSQGDTYFDNSFTISGNCVGICGGLTAAEALAIDTKIDDGAPTTGTVQVMYPYPGPRVNFNGPGCDYQVWPGPWFYDTKGLWADYASQIANTPPNPGQLGCALALTKRF